MTKTYNTPQGTYIVKTRMDDEEHADFLHQVKNYGMNQSEFIREAISCATIRPVIVASNDNDAMLESIRKLTTEFGRIGSILPLVAVTRELNIRKLTFARVYLEAGLLPLTWMCEQKDSFKAYLLQNEAIDFIEGYRLSC